MTLAQFVTCILGSRNAGASRILSHVSIRVKLLRNDKMVYFSFICFEIFVFYPVGNVTAQMLEILCTRQCLQIVNSPILTTILTKHENFFFRWNKISYLTSFHKWQQGYKFVCLTKCFVFVTSGHNPGLLILPRSLQMLTKWRSLENW